MAKYSAAQMQRAKEMHDDCMRDPGYAAKWNALAAQVGHLTDIPEEALYGVRENDPSA